MSGPNGLMVRPPITRRRNDKHHPKSYIWPVGRAGLEPATNGL